MTTLLRTRRSLPHLSMSTLRYSGEKFRELDRVDLLSPGNRSLHAEVQSGFRRYRGPGRRYSPVVRVGVTEPKKEFPARIREPNEPRRWRMLEASCQCL